MFHNDFSWVREMDFVSHDNLLVLYADNEGKDETDKGL